VQKQLGQLEEQHRDEYTRPLQKKIATKDKALVDKERMIAFVGESNHKHQEELKLENN
jgi:hypothetical protein